MKTQLKIKTFMVVATFGVSVASCSKQPTSCFTTSSSTAQVGEAIDLDASCSTEAEQYIWSDDSNGSSSYTSGGTSSKLNTVTFGATGVYSIILTVENGKKNDESTLQITVQ